MNRLPESWIAPPETRELRELIRYRAKLVALKCGLKSQVHSVLAKKGVKVPMSDLFGVQGDPPAQRARARAGVRVAGRLPEGADLCP